MHIHVPLLFRWGPLGFPVAPPGAFRGPPGGPLGIACGCSGPLAGLWWVSSRAWPATRFLKRRFSAFA